MVTITHNALTGIPAPIPRRVGLQVAIAVLVGIGNYTCARLGYTLIIHPAGVSMVWPGSGFVLALLLLAPAPDWAAIIVGALVGNLVGDHQYGASIPMAFAGSAANALESVLAATVVVRLVGRGITLESLREVSSLILGAAILSNAVTAALGALVLKQWTHMPLTRGWFVWWTGDGMGMLIVAPAILTCVHLAASRPRLRLRSAVEIVIALAATAFLARAALTDYPYIAFPLLMWSAVRFGPQGAATATLILSGITEWNAALGQGPFASPGSTWTSQIVQLYLYLGLASLSSLVPASILTERRLAEQRLRTSERRFRQMAEHINEAFFVLDLASGEILYVSPTWAEIWGLSLTHAYDPRIWLDAVHPDDRAQVAAAQDAVKLGQPSTVVFRVVRPAGSTRWVRGRVYPVRNDGGEVYRLAGVYEDITLLRQVEERFSQSQKMEAVGRLAGGIAHDFNNLLTAIIGSSDLLLEDLLPTDQRRGDVEEIKQAGERAAALTRQLLTFSRKQVVEPAVLDLNVVIADVEKMLRRLIGEDIEFQTVLAPGLGSVRADRGQLQQVIMNLAVNARDAMPQGGKLTIETVNVELQDVYAADEGSPVSGPFVMVAVSDTGVGMTPEVQAHIFEPFFTTKEQGKGTGLGLATVYGIAKQSDGHVRVYSEPGRGTTFKFYLPRVSARAEPALSTPAPPDSFQGSETVLVVEDEAAVRQLTHRILRKLGYDVLTASDGTTALQMLERHEGAIHVLLTDVVMPGMSGRQLAERVLAVRPAMKVLYLSGYTDDAIVRHGVLEPGTAFLQKPFTPQGLARKLREVLDAR